MQHKKQQSISQAVCLLATSLMDILVQCKARDLARACWLQMPWHGSSCALGRLVVVVGLVLLLLPVQRRISQGEALETPLW